MSDSGSEPFCIPTKLCIKCAIVGAFWFGNEPERDLGLNVGAAAWLICPQVPTKSPEMGWPLPPRHWTRATKSVAQSARDGYLAPDRVPFLCLQRSGRAWRSPWRGPTVGWSMARSNWGPLQTSARPSSSIWTAGPCTPCVVGAGAYPLHPPVNLYRFGAVGGPTGHVS